MALLGTLPVALALTMLASASAPPPRPVRAADQLDYLFLASDRPVRIRLHVRIGEQPYDAAWVEFMDNLFAWFDKDKTGFLSSGETARVPNVQALQTQIQGSIGQNIATVPFATLDTNKDGKVSKEEFRSYYRNSGFAGLNFSTNNSQAMQARQINEALLNRLDRNGDGKLSADEVVALYEKLRSLDENEDEMLTEAELNTKVANGGYNDVIRLSGDTIAVPTTEPGLVSVTLGQEASVIQQIIARYDRNKDGKLSRSEVGLDKSHFDALDRDRDGFLSVGELRAFLDGQPDLVGRLQLGLPTQGKGFLSRIGFGAALSVGPRLVVVNEKKLTGSLKKTLRRPNGDTLGIELGDTRLSLQANGSQGNAFVRRNNGASNFYIGEFATLSGKKGYVERSQQKGASPYLFQIFAQADQDADGKLSRKELVAWLDLINSGQDCNVSVVVNDLGRGLFPILDSDSDSRLSLREMKNAWSRLSPLTKDGKSLALANVPRTMRIAVGQGNNTFYQPVVVAFYGDQPIGRPVVRGAIPQWFTKMDRNNDGDISPREWLGTEEEFAEIDRNGDGLISGDEAIAFEAKKKTKAIVKP